MRGAFGRTAWISEGREIKCASGERGQEKEEAKTQEVQQEGQQEGQEVQERGFSLPTEERARSAGGSISGRGIGVAEEGLDERREGHQKRGGAEVGTVPRER